MKAVARTMEKHREGIRAWFGSRISNGPIEGINATVQAAKSRANGYRNSGTLKAMTYRRQTRPQATHLKRRGAARRLEDLDHHVRWGHG